MQDKGMQARSAPGVRVVIRDCEGIVGRHDAVDLQRACNHILGNHNPFYHSVRAKLHCANGTARSWVAKAAAAVKALVPALHRAADIAKIASNTPAKPRLTSVFMLKSSGFFIVSHSDCFRDLDGGSAS